MQNYFDRETSKYLHKRNIENGFPASAAAILESFDAFCRTVAEEAVKNNEDTSLEQFYKPAENVNALLIEQLSAIALHYSYELRKARKDAEEQAL